LIIGIDYDKAERISATGDNKGTNTILVKREPGLTRIGDLVHHW
jgi:hypothetical protein